MGSGKSRQWFGLGSKKYSPSYGYGGNGKYHKISYYQRKPSISTLPIEPTITPSVSYQPLYGFNYPLVPVPAYGQLQPISSPYLPIVPNTYQVRPQIPPQYMMMQPSPFVPSPYMSPPVSTPYIQQQQQPRLPQIQPVYNNYNNNIGYPNSIPAGNAYYPSAYPSAPARLITDWTGGGKISPGFLGPPL